MKEIPLTKGLVALVDAADFAKISKFKWCASRESRNTKWYAIRVLTVNGKRIKIRMSYAVFDIDPLQPLLSGFVIDHLNDDGLDNRRSCNLRIHTQTYNMHRCPGWKKKLDPTL